MSSIKLFPQQIAFLEAQVDIEKSNQKCNSSLLIPPNDFDFAYLTETLNILLNHHDILRTSFFYKNDQWNGECKVYNTQSIEDSLQLVSLDDFEEEERDACIEYFCASAIAALNIFSGDLIKVIYFESEKGKQLFTAIHELACDKKSFNFFISDLEDVYRSLVSKKQPFLKSPKINLNQLSQCIDDRLLRFSNEENSYWIDALRERFIGSIPFDGLNFENNDQGDTKFYTTKLSKELSHVLINHCSTVYCTQVTDLLLSALIKTFEKITGQAKLRILQEDYLNAQELEGYAETENILAPFKYTYPLTLRASGEAEWPELIKSIKEQKRNVPHLGLGYIGLRYIKEDQEIIDLTKNPESWIKINFNFPIEKPEKKNTSFFTKTTDAKSYEVYPVEIRQHLLAITFALSSEELHVTIDYNETQYQEQRIAHIAAVFKSTLEDLIHHCQETHVVRHTPSDFPFATLTQFEIEDLEFKFGIIENLYPASDLQKGLVYHLHSRSVAPINQFILSLNERLNLLALKKSWQLLIQGNPILRTVFYGDFENLHQVVLPEVILPLTFMDWRNKNATQHENDLIAYAKSTKSNHLSLYDSPLFNLTIIQLHNDQCQLIWNTHLALLDIFNIQKIVLELNEHYAALTSKDHIVSSPLFIQDTNYLNPVIRLIEAITSNNTIYLDSIQLDEKSIIEDNTNKKNKNTDNTTPKENIQTTLHPYVASLNTYDFSIRQIKRRGFVVPFARIEAGLLQINNVLQAVIVVTQNAMNEQCLTALLVAAIKYDETEKENTITKIKADLLKIIPSYMIPNEFLFIDAIPTKNSVIFSQSSGSSSTKNITQTIEYLAPTNETESIIASIWKEVLSLDSVGISDNFYKLGGDSLKAVKVFSKLKDQGIVISLIDIFESKNIADLATRISSTSYPVQLDNSKNIKGVGRLLPYHIFYLNQLKDKPWNISTVSFLPNRLNKEIMSKVLEYCYHYHDALRINFKGNIHSQNPALNIMLVNYGPDEIKPNLQIHNWIEYNQELFIQKTNEDIHQIESFNTYDKPNLSAFRIYQGPSGDLFYMMNSHLISDAHSFEQLKTDIFNWYSILSAGNKIAFERKTDSYLSVTQQIYAYANSEEVLKEIPFWENLFSEFKNNVLFPRDIVLKEEDKKVKNITLQSQILLSDLDAKHLNDICLRHNTTVIDLILTTFGQSIKDTYALNKFIVTFINSGRQLTFSTIDIARTLGCFVFTSYLKIDTSDDNLTLLEKSTRHTETRKSYKNGGLAGALLLAMSYYKKLDANSPLQKRLDNMIPANVPIISFNYFDQRNPTTNTSETNKQISTTNNQPLLIQPSKDIYDLGLLKINIYHTNRMIVLECGYNNIEYRKETIENLIVSIKQKIEHLVNSH